MFIVDEHGDDDHAADDVPRVLPSGSQKTER